MAGTKVITRRRKFQEVEVPFIKSRIELLGENISEIEGRNIKMDLTRQLRGKSVEVIIKVINQNGKPVAIPIKLKLMPYFIRRMIRKKISYVEDSFLVPSQESMLVLKPFLITRKKVSRAVRKALRNRTKNWLEDYISQLSDKEIFDDILSNKLQKNLSLVLKKTYPLSLCEIRILEINRALNQSEIPKKIEKKEASVKIEEESFIDQMAEIEQEKIKKAEEEMKKTQMEASNKEAEEKLEKAEEDIKKETGEEPKKPQKVKANKKKTEKNKND